MDLKEYFPNKIYIARSLHTTDALFAKKKGEILNSTINNIFKAIIKQKSFLNIII